MLCREKIYLAGHRGMVGKALLRALKNHGVSPGTIITASHQELDLRNQSATNQFFSESRPSLVIVAAAKVGGIYANNVAPVEFAYDNVMIGSNVIRAAHQYGVKRLLFLGSSCIYPKLAEQPIKEESLLSGFLEPTNEAYALAKIFCLKLCEYYRRQYGRLYHSAMPCNLFGPGDNYHPENSHVIPGLIRRFHEAKESSASSVRIWGSGTPRREFLYADDLARACIFLLNIEDPPDLVNIGSGCDVTISELAELVARAVGFQGCIENDLSKPDGTPRKLMDSSKIYDLGWQPETTLEKGLKLAYEDYLKEGYQ